MTEELIGGNSIYSDAYHEAQQKIRVRSEEAVRAADSARYDGQEVTVLIVDDQDLVRNGFRLILSSYEFIKVVGEADNGLAAYDQALKLKPDVVLMDIRMPLENGIDATRKILSDPNMEGTRVLVLTTFDVDEYVYDALQAGASGFMLKDSEPDDIAQAIRTVAAGEALIQPSITRRLIEAFVETRAQEARAETSFSILTDREREVLRLAIDGKDTQGIATELFISTGTVKAHMHRIYSKAGVEHRQDLINAFWKY